MKRTVFFAIMAAVMFCGCHAVYDANKVDVEDHREEAAVVFTRPARFAPWFGSYSVSEFIEITYASVSRNEAGLLVAEVGIRNRGPVEWTNWHMNAPERITLRTTCNFYRGKRNHSPIIYSTNSREIVIGRGETYACKIICPAPEAQDFQLILSH